MIYRKLHVLNVYSVHDGVGRAGPASQILTCGEEGGHATPFAERESGASTSCITQFHIQQRLWLRSLRDTSEQCEPRPGRRRGPEVLEALVLGPREFSELTTDPGQDQETPSQGQGLGRPSCCSGRCISAPLQGHPLGPPLLEGPHPAGLVSASSRSWVWSSASRCQARVMSAG